MADARLDKRWITQVTINFGDDDELPALARAAGCAGVFIGLESTDTKSLTLIRKDGTQERLPSKCDEIQVEAGDMLVYRTAGGGG